MGVVGYLVGIADTLAETSAAKRHVRSLYGRRRCFCGEDSLTDREIRQARNAVVQMLEADVFKITVLELDRVFKSTGMPVKIVLLLHDGIWFTSPKERATVARVTAEIQKIMENSVSLPVPLVVTFASI